jgi:hypothetical protein
MLFDEKSRQENLSDRNQPMRPQDIQPDNIWQNGNQQNNTRRNIIKSCDKRAKIWHETVLLSVVLLSVVAPPVKGGKRKRWAGAFFLRHPIV